MKKVSVILTTYNSERTIKKTINSILNQDDINDEFEIEVIVVDDCSGDNTCKIVNEYNILLFSTKKNSGGPNKGRNIGLKKASGDYICITDHDDVWEKHRIISLLPYLNKVPIVSSGYTLLDKSQNKKIKRVKASSKEYVYYNHNQTFLSKLSRSSKGQMTYLASLIYKSELKNNLFEENFGVNDKDWTLRLFHNQDSIEVCESLYYRIVLGNNFSLNESYRINDFYYFLICINKYFDLYPGEVRKGYYRYHGSMARYYYFIGNMKKARFYFLKSYWNFKTFLYYITTYFGSKLVKKKFNVFG